MDEDVVDDYPQNRPAREDAPRPDPEVIFDLLRREEMHERWCDLPTEEQYRRMDEQGESIWYRISQEAQDVLDWLGALLTRHQVLHPHKPLAGSRQMVLRAWGERTGNLDLAAVAVALSRGWSDGRIIAVIRARLNPKEIAALSDEDIAGLEMLMALKGPPPSHEWS